jgi:hypothetical protein
MANELQISYPSGATAGSILVTIIRISDAKIWYTVTPAFETNNNAHIASYGVALTDQGNDLYTANMPTGIGAGAYIATPYFEPTLAHTTGTDPLGPPLRINWNGYSVTSSIGGAQGVTVGELVDRLRVAARNAGITDLADTTNDLTFKHIAVQDALDDFVRRTKCTRQHDTVAVTSGDEEVDFSGIDGFHGERWLKMWIEDQDTMTVSEIDELLSLRKSCAKTTIPTALAFTDPQTGILRETPNANYTLHVIWWPPPPHITPGDTSSDTANTVVNIVRDLAVEAIYTKGVLVLQQGKLEPSEEMDRLTQKYDALCARAAGLGNLGVKYVTRTIYRQATPR